MEGIKYVTKEKCHLFVIEYFSDELKGRIKAQLASVWHGLVHAEELDYDYKYTLKSFFDTYDSKTLDTKKGMIGELLTHILINTTIDDLNSLSILKNKEERSIKKGFDIIYYHPGMDEIWYTEVKSGSPLQGSTSSDDDNIILLKRSHTSIKEMLESKRSKLWENALIDVKLMVENGPNQIDINKLLKNDLSRIDQEDTKNVILISVLFKEVSQCIKFESVIRQYSIIPVEDFKDKIVISIQKSTYQAVEDFLHLEALKDD